MWRGRTLKRRFLFPFRYPQKRRVERSTEMAASQSGLAGCLVAGDP
jgi:hypothetical protein